MESSGSSKPDSPVKDPQSKSRSSSDRGGSWRRRFRSEDPNEWRNPGNTLFVKYLPHWVIENHLRELFSRQGGVLQCRVIRNFRTQLSEGYAFITMETNEEAKRCIEHFHWSVQFGRLIIVELARRKRPRSPTPGRFYGRGYHEQDAEQRGRRTRSNSPESSHSRERSRSRTPIRMEDRYRRSSRDRPEKSPSQNTHESQEN